MEDFYILHNENLKTIDKSIKIIERQLKKTISENYEVTVTKKNKQTNSLEEITRKNKQEEVIAFTRLFSYLITCWAEVRILKIIFERKSFPVHNKSLTDEQKINLGKQNTPAFSDDEKKFLLGQSTAKDKWKKTFLLGIAKAYGITVTLENNGNIEPTNFYETLDDKIKKQIEDIDELIETQLFPSQQLRNRIAHGQWITAFSSNLRSINLDFTASLQLTPTYLLTDLIISKIRNAGVPEFIINRLKNIKDEIYTNLTTFENDILNLINSSDYQQHKKEIIKFSYRNGENIEVIQLKQKIFKDLSQLIHDATVSKATFTGGFYKVTSQSINELKREVSSISISSLLQIKDKRFSNENDFISRIVNIIDEEIVNNNKNILLDKAYCSNFGVLYERIKQNTIKLGNRDYPKYELKMIEKQRNRNNDNTP